MTSKVVAGIDLLELAGRIERGNLSFDEVRSIEDAIYTHVTGKAPFNCATAPRYTASLDAAMTLINGDTFFYLSRFDLVADGRSEAHVYPNRYVGDDYKAEAATPALALCAAALRARASLIEGGGE